MDKPAMVPQVLVDHKHQLVIFWSFGAAHAQLIRFVHELVTGDVLTDVYSLVHPLEPNGHIYAEESLEGLGGYTVMAVVEDPWLRLVKVYREFMVRLKAHTILDSKYKFVNGLHFPFQDMVKLGGLLKEDVRAPILQPQVPAGGYPEGTTVLTLDQVYGHLTNVLKAKGVDPATLKTLSDLSPRALRDDAKATAMGRAFVGHLPSSTFALSAMPPAKTFYNTELWSIVKEVYESDLAACPFLKRDFNAPASSINMVWSPSPGPTQPTNASRPEFSGLGYPGRALNGVPVETESEEPHVVGHNSS